MWGAIILLFQIYIINMHTKQKSVFRKEVIQMNESKIISSKDIPVSENEIIKRIKTLSSDIMKIYFPHNDNKIINSSIGHLK